MKALFPYVGESILREILAADSTAVLAAFARSGITKCEVLQQVPLSFPRAKILFDGFQCVDLGLLLNKAELIPLEIKLGRKGLNRVNIEKLLSSCTISGHPGHQRLAGN